MDQRCQIPLLGRLADRPRKASCDEGLVNGVSFGDQRGHACERVCVCVRVSACVCRNVHRGAALVGRVLQRGGEAWRVTHPPGPPSMLLPSLLLRASVGVPAGGS